MGRSCGAWCGFVVGGVLLFWLVAAHEGQPDYSAWFATALLGGLVGTGLFLVALFTEQHHPPEDRP